MGESFAWDTKEEVLAVKNKMMCCRISTLYGMMFGSSSFSKTRIAFDTDNPHVAIGYVKLLRELLKTRRVSDADMFDIADGKFISEIMTLFGINEDGNISEINTGTMKCELCRWSFVRGVFLACATISAPESSYHLEFSLKDRNQALSLHGYFEMLGLSPKFTVRESSFGVYFKDSESIVDLLGYIGASNAVFAYMNAKIIKNVRNDINRKQNFETANLGKTIAASSGQMRAIERIILSGKSSLLSDELRETLDIRAAFPDATLAELAEKHSPPITKSGVNHRLQKLIEFSKKC